MHHITRNYTNVHECVPNYTNAYHCVLLAASAKSSSTSPQTATSQRTQRTQRNKQAHFGPISLLSGISCSCVYRQTRTHRQGWRARTPQSLQFRHYATPLTRREPPVFTRSPATGTHNCKIQRKTTHFSPHFTSPKSSNVSLQELHRSLRATRSITEALTAQSMYLLTSVEDIFVFKTSNIRRENGRNIWTYPVTIHGMSSSTERR